MTRQDATATDAAQLVHGLILGLSTHRHVDLPVVCEELGLPAPPPEESGSASGSLTKAQRLEAVFSKVPHDSYPTVLQRFLDAGGVRAEIQHEVEDRVWATQSWPRIPNRTRREVASALDTVGPFWAESGGLATLVDQYFAKDTAWPAALSGRTFGAEVLQRLAAEGGTALQCFGSIGALTCSDRRFALFLQGLLSGGVNPDETRLHALASAADSAFKGGGLRLVEVESQDGYPTFHVMAADGSARPPRQVLFASLIKPDMRLVDVLDVEIEHMTSDEQLLCYTQPIGSDGLTWQDLQAWWRDKKGCPSDSDAKNTLWTRLVASIPTSSPPQLEFFNSYHRIFGQRDSFPALLPEAWVHWDPQTVAQRGDEAFRAHRMDFLMLLRDRRRIVIEVDGRQHYTDETGQSSATAYANTMRGDRELRLNGYEVYRFGGHELVGDQVGEVLRSFFERLFAR